MLEQRAHTPPVTSDRPGLLTLDITPHRKTVDRLASELDPDTQQHMHRVSSIVEILGLHAGIPQHIVEVASEVAKIHDIGKAHPLISEGHLLHKPVLSGVEWTDMQAHTHFGAQKAAEAGLPQEYQEIILHHHEEENGSGYPGSEVQQPGTSHKNGWTKAEMIAHLGEDLTLATQLVHIADVLDSIANPHYTKPGKGWTTAVAEVIKGIDTGKYPEEFRQAVRDMPEIDARKN